MRLDQLPPGISPEDLFLSVGNHGWTMHQVVPHWVNFWLWAAAIHLSGDRWLW